MMNNFNLISNNNETILLLRHAFNQCSSMPAEYKKNILRIYLQYLLREGAFEKLNLFKIAVNIQKSKQKINSRIRAGNSNKDDVILPKKLLSIDNSLSKKRVSPETGLPAIEAIGRVDMLFNLNDVAMDKAVASIIAKLLEAMDPVLIQKNVKKNTFSSSAKYNVSVYKAYVAKYKRLKLYNDKGRLVVDFRTRFKQCLKNELIKAGEI